MRKGLLLYIVVSMMLSGCSLCTPRKENTFHFEVGFEQNGNIKPVLNNEVYLKREPFTILVTFAEPDSIFVNASFNDASYRAALTGKKLNAIPGFEGEGIQEELYNEDKLLFLSDKKANQWYYHNKSSHRFNAVLKKNELFLCRRLVENLSVDLVDDSKKKIAVKECTKEGIYLVFVKYEWNKRYDKKIEKKRYAVKIVFPRADKDNDKGSGGGS